MSVARSEWVRFGGVNGRVVPPGGGRVMWGGNSSSLCPLAVVGVEDKARGGDAGGDPMREGSGLILRCPPSGEGLSVRDGVSMPDSDAEAVSSSDAWYSECGGEYSKFCPTSPLSTSSVSSTMSPRPRECANVNSWSRASLAKSDVYENENGQVNVR